MPNRKDVLGTMMEGGRKKYSHYRCSDPISHIPEGSTLAAEWLYRKRESDSSKVM